MRRVTCSPERGGFPSAGTLAAMETNMERSCLFIRWGYLVYWSNSIVLFALQLGRSQCAIVPWMDNPGNRNCLGLEGTCVV